MSFGTTKGYYEGAELATDSSSQALRLSSRHELRAPRFTELANPEQFNRRAPSELMTGNDRPNVFLLRVHGREPLTRSGYVDDG